MVGAIVGFRHQGEADRRQVQAVAEPDAEDRRRVAAGLDGEGYADAAATAAWMRGMA